MAEKQVILRSSALSLFFFLGWGTASKWPNDRMAEKLVNVPDVMTNEPTDPDMKKTVIDVMAAIEGKKTIEVIDDPADTVVTGTVEGGTETTATTGTATEGKPAAAKEPKPPKAPKPPAAAKEPKPAKPAVAAVQKVGNIRPANNRIYYAAQVLKKHGLEGGVTDEMAKEVDALCEKPNLKESTAWTKICWDAINGYLQQYPVTPTTTAAKVDAVAEPVAPAPAAEVAAPVAEVTAAE